jgi:hypothetical protein
MSAEHTPVPWTLGGRATIRASYAPRYVATLENNEERAANAEFIVRAANSHYGLVAALKEAIAELNECCESLNGEGYNNPHFNDILAEAEGRS